jgi:hypothetical protein
MVAITAEYDHPTTVAISNTDKQFFHENRFPPASFRIWIGHVPGEAWGVNWVHHPMAIKEQDETVLGDALANLNAVTSTHVLGEFLVHIMSCPYSDILAAWRFPPRVAGSLMQIWPLTLGDAFWPPLRSLDESTATQVASAFLEFSINSHRRHRVARGLGLE